MRSQWLAGFVFACALAAQPQPGAGSIEGRVVNSLTGLPVRKAVVTLRAPEIWLTADADIEGKFQFTGLPPGTYKLSATQAGFFQRAARRPITLGQDDRVTDAKILLPPYGVITGRVLDADGDPLGGARLQIFKPVYQDGLKKWDRVNTGALTNASGEYRFVDLRPGRYLVQADSSRPMINNHYGNRDRPVMSYVPTYYPNAPSEQAALPVALGVGAEVRGIDIHLLRLAQPLLPPTFRVSGRVTGAPPGSEIGVNLSLPDDSRVRGNAVARPPDYTFEMNVPRGLYTISSYMYAPGPAAFAARRSISVAGELTGVMVTLSPPPELAARISVAESGSPVKLQGVRVILNLLPAHPGSENVGRSDATGKLVFDKPIAPGRYSIDVETRTIPDGCFLQRVKLGGEEVFSDFEIQSSTELEIVLSNTAGTITGSVLDGDGKPFPGFAATLIPTDGKSRPAKQSADDDGTFKFTGLRPGKYQLFAWEEVDDAVWQDPDFRKMYESRATEITVGPSETKTAQLRLIPIEAMQ